MKKRIIIAALVLGMCGCENYSKNAQSFSYEDARRNMLDTDIGKRCDAENWPIDGDECQQLETAIGRTLMHMAKKEDSK